MLQNPTRSERYPCRPKTIEWPTLLVLTLCYGMWIAGLVLWNAVHWFPASLILILAITLQSSLQHEVIHGHPTPSPLVNTLLVFPALLIFEPFERYRQTHLAHHNDEDLTLPGVDPESYYYCPVDWPSLPKSAQLALRIRNCVFGRMLLAPFIGWAKLYSSDFKRMLSGNVQTMRAYFLHAASLVPVLYLINDFSVSMIGYGLCAYAAASLISLRSFLEHRAAQNPNERTVIVEGSGLFSFLYLNNNLHALHHEAPGCPWYALPALYREKKGELLQKNGQYIYPSYWSILRQHLFVQKEQVPHPAPTWFSSK